MIADGGTSGIGAVNYLCVGIRLGDRPAAVKWMNLILLSFYSLRLLRIGFSTYRRSAGFGVSAGITQSRPIFWAVGSLPRFAQDLAVACFTPFAAAQSLSVIMSPYHQIVSGLLLVRYPIAVDSKCIIDGIAIAWVILATIAVHLAGVAIYKIVNLLWYPCGSSS